jgi:predicted DNA-binding protein YlxM (UPF0122 family)
MKYKTKVVTFDNVEHDCVRDAIDHLKRRESAFMAQFEHRLNMKKSNEVREVIDSNLQYFVELDKIRKDIKDYPTHDEEG